MQTLDAFIKVNILYIQYANPGAFPPVIHSSHIFAQRGHKVHFIGNHAIGSETLQMPSHPNISLSIGSHTARGLKQKLNYFTFLLKSIIKGIFWPADCIYVSNNLATPAGWVLKKVFRKKVIYHEHDDPTQPKESLFYKTVKVFRKSLARSASLVVVPQKTRLKLFLRETGRTKPSHCVWNCPMTEHTLIKAPAIRAPGKPLGIYFHGTINLNMIPAELIEAAGRLNIPIIFRIVGYETPGAAGSIEALKNLAKPYVASLKLEIIGPLSRDQLFNAMNEMHVGWINFPTNVSYHNSVMRHLAGASNKAFDYLAGSLALIYPNDDEWEQLYSPYGKPCNSRSIRSISSVLQWFYDHPKETLKMTQMGHKKIQEEWNYTNQFSPVYNHIVCK